MDLINLDWIEIEAVDELTELPHRHHLLCLKQLALSINL